MGSKYTTQQVSGYNSSPPPDDGTTVSANQVKWATIKNKLTDCFNTWASAINSALLTALDVSNTTTAGNYTTTATDHQKPIEVTGNAIISLGDAVTMGAGYQVPIVNLYSSAITVNLATNTNKLNTVTNGAVRIPVGNSATFAINQAVNGYVIVGESNWLSTGPYHGWAPRGHIGGLTMSTAGGSSTMSIASGEAADSTNTEVMMLASAINKTTSAWAVGSGNGGLDGGSIANTTWYHFFLIIRPDTGVTDILFSTSPTSPTLPTNYTLFRRIGCGLTDGSAHWTAFVQDGELFEWNASVQDVNAVNPGNAAVLRTLTVPTGVNVVALMNAGSTTNTTNIPRVYLSDPAVSDEGPADSATPFCSVTPPPPSSGVYGGGNIRIRTNTSAQIRSRVNASDAGTTLRIATLGWVDTRGRYV